ncbi:MAG: carbohydrate binding family 9 domain-containing protein [Gemmatimonadetes bacterium]|nr:carbohydrate binding family 9 domain-containing protein [Gemmatimonadota bacterium]
MRPSVLLLRAAVCALLLVPAIVPARVTAQPSTSRPGPGRREPEPASASTERRSVATRALKTPVLDGRDDDAAWKDARVIDQFLEYEPQQGAVPRFRTEVRVLYDDRYLYVLGRMHDPAPDSIISLLSRRDVRTESEQLKLVIDSYHDRRTAFQFITNPAGVKRDFYVYNDNTEDVTWDAVWDVATSVDSLGWVAEFRIPFSQMRFAPGDEKTFGLLIVRDVARTRQRISWPLYRRDVQGYVSQGGELGGIAKLPSPRRVEVTPYVVEKSATRQTATGYTAPLTSTVGADLKLGIGSNLTVDATINPDFGQVEADPSVLNLSAFEQFFEERRPFFLEGAGIFQFRTACNDIDTGCTGLFYSRRIGRSPQLLGRYGDSESATASRILGAGKLSGRLANGLSVGALTAITERELGSARRTIEPTTSYGVLRLQQDLRNGQSGIGLMLTGVERQGDQWTRDFLRNSAYTGGIDLRHRFAKNNYEVAASLSGSLVRGSAKSITALQRNSVHQYDRPDDALVLDTTATSMVGDAQRISLSKFGGGVTRFQSVLQRYSAGFETNDLGFQSRADEVLFRNWFSLQFIRPTRFYRRAQLNFNTNNRWSAAGLAIGQGLNTNWHVELPNTWWLHWGMNANSLIPVYNDRMARGGPAVRLNRNLNTFLGWEGDRRTWYTPVLFMGGFKGAGNSNGWWIEPSLQFRVSSRFSASLAGNYDRTIDDGQWHSNPVVAGTPHYTFARLYQSTFRSTARVNYTVTPTLSLQVYGQPFVSTGRYTNWRELADPRADTWEARFRPWAGDPGGFRLREFRSNTVVRWEYRPASVLFLVWQQGRSLYDPRASDFDFPRDVGRVFELHPMNTLLLKASWWFNP